MRNELLRAFGSYVLMALWVFGSHHFNNQRHRLDRWQTSFTGAINQETLPSWQSKHD
jgi:hypothetical protein